MKVFLWVVAAIVLSTPAWAGMEKLSEVDWWAAHGGAREDGAHVCALVTVTPDGRGGKLVIEHVSGSNNFLIRLLKPDWSIPTGQKSRITLQFGYNKGQSVAAVGSEHELRIQMPLENLDAFLSGFRSAGRLDVVFLNGNETAWSLAAGGEGFVEPDFIKCIKMAIPAKPKPATQPY
jgi:hypothetical protein